MHNVAAVASQQEVAGFAQRFSIEATRPSAAEIAALAGILPRDSPVYFSAVPTIAREEIVATTSRMRRVGMEPVVHIAARRIGAAIDLHELLERLRGEADVKRLLVIGGDIDACGPYPDALSVIMKGRLHEAGIEEIGIGAYSEEHQRIAPARLEAALDEKLAACAAVGLGSHIVSQFSFSPEHILVWLKKLRVGGITHPVKIGVAGPTSVPTLLRYAKRCGVTASLRGLMAGTGGGLIGRSGPDMILAKLAAADGVGDIAQHYFSFGGVLETARYTCQAAHGKQGADRAMAQ